MKYKVFCPYCERILEISSEKPIMDIDHPDPDVIGELAETCPRCDWEGGLEVLGGG